MTQLNLIPGVCYPDVPGARRTDTSRDAAASIEDRADALRCRVMFALWNGDQTADEIAEYMGVDRLSIRPRCSELSKLGKIVDSGLRRKNASGKNAIVWKLC